MSDAQAAIGTVLKIVVNGIPETTAARTLQEWVEAQGVQPNALATAVNANFVPRTQRAQCLLADGNTIVTFQPIQGG